MRVNDSELSMTWNNEGYNLQTSLVQYYKPKWRLIASFCLVAPNPSPLARLLYPYITIQRLDMTGVDTDAWRHVFTH